ncbi:uncharacterized protein K460DRAFT_354115 [Cucurbitaria berberidis CBS 394.84]|uniref:non-specific serine/threonine protein kinase n=1 Tax=Cucurbitaria berberidis CBS 394.84 TaxID=1168544 RepID=A0A9P4LB68_9PLEO|nr:uncharacterized protein K460DRAFT_354115 [Cucurbitaria berberidis CBS 394.84]KAF1849246.1 hypothetical protein K460DRAFT_354115 [Cucurbitaria berberidis CBS 394.84]
MPRHSPPFKEAKTYFKFDAKAWIAINRPHWTITGKNNTVETIWAGSATTRAHYDAHKVNHPDDAFTPGLPNPHHIPDQPYTAANATAAKRGGQLPDAAGEDGRRARSGEVATPSEEAPDNASAALSRISIPEDGERGGGAATAIPHEAPSGVGGTASTAGSSAALRKDNSLLYPFEFWPSLPWPEDPDTSNWPTHAALSSRDLVARAAFLDSFGRFNLFKAGLEEWSWNGVKFLGAGAFGSAGLWVQIDHNRNIRKRKVIKDTKPQPHEWRDPSYWRNHLPREIRIHQLVDEHRGYNGDLFRKADRKRLVKHYSHRLMMHRRRYRIYLKYYPGGDIQSSLQWANMIELDTMQRPHVVPEGFIWHVLVSLVKACRVLRTGFDHPLPDMGEDLFADWKPVTHLDISLRNIFLKEAGDLGVPRPQIVLSDFGQAFFDMEARPGLPEHSQENPQEYLIGADNTAWAPEHQDAIGDPPIRIGEKTDIWNIGATIWNLMAGNPEYVGGPRGPQREDYTTDHYQSIPVSGYNVGPMQETSIFPIQTVYRQAADYSADLKDVVTSCLQWAVQDRPDLDELETWIQRFATANPHIWNDPSPPPVARTGDIFRDGEYLGYRPGQRV